MFYDSSFIDDSLLKAYRKVDKLFVYLQVLWSSAIGLTNPLEKGASKRCIFQWWVNEKVIEISVHRDSGEN